MTNKHFLQARMFRCDINMMHFALILPSLFESRNSIANSTRGLGFAKIALLLYEQPCFFKYVPSPGEDDREHHRDRDRRTFDRLYDRTREREPSRTCQA